MRRWLVVAAALVALAGCKGVVNVGATVEEDGSGELTFTVVMADTVRQMFQPKELVSEDPKVLQELLAQGKSQSDLMVLGPDPIDVMLEDVPPGWKAEKAELRGLPGVRLTAGFDDVEAIRDLLERLPEWASDIVDEYQLGGTIRDLTRGFQIVRESDDRMVFSAHPSARTIGKQSGVFADPEGQGTTKGGAEIVFSIALPGKILEHDADERDGNRLTWTIPNEKARKISAVSDPTASAGSGGFPVAPVGIAGALVALSGLVVWRRRGRDAGPGEPPDDSAPEPVAVPV